MYCVPGTPVPGTPRPFNLISDIGVGVAIGMFANTPLILAIASGTWAVCAALLKLPVVVPESVFGIYSHTQASQWVEMMPMSERLSILGKEAFKALFLAAVVAGALFLIRRTVF